VRFERGRLAAHAYPGFASFAAVNPDLLDRRTLVRWYSPRRLASRAARDTLLLSDLG
jgi:hypothetical protein